MADFQRPYKQLMITQDRLPVPLPNEDLPKVREWLHHVLPLAACGDYAFTIRQVHYDCGPDAPEWVRKLARQVSEIRPKAIDVQVTCYCAMANSALNNAYEKVFGLFFDAPAIWVDAPIRFQKYMNFFYQWKFGGHAMEMEAFRENVAEGRMAISRVRFEVNCDPFLFPELEK